MDSEPESASAAATSHFGTQFVASMKKNIQQKVRAPISCILETCMPIFFVLGAVGIWAAVGANTYPSASFVRYDDPPINITQQAAALFCLNATSSPLLLLLPACTIGAPIICLPPPINTTLPSVCTLPTSNPYQLLSAFLNHSKPRPIPTLDEMIFTQWVAKPLLGDTSQEEFWSDRLSLSVSGKLYFTPDTPATAALVSYMRNTSILFPFVYGGTFPTMSAASSQTQGVDREGQHWGIVSVNALTSAKFDVTIRLNRSALVWSNLVIDELYSGGVAQGSDGETAFRSYFNSGFLTLQRTITEYYTTQILGRALPNATAMLASMPYPRFTSYSFLKVGAKQGYIALFFVMSYLYPVSQITKSIVLEKELRIREAMHIMGLGSGSFYTSWFATYSLEVIFSSLMSAMITKLTFFSNSNFAILFFFNLLFGLSSLALANVMATVFSKARLAALVAPIVYFAISIPIFVVNGLSPVVQGILCILSPSAMSIGVNLIAKHEQSTGMGNAQLSSKLDDITMLGIMFAIGIDTVGYVLLALYLDAVFPSEWGTRRHPLFCFIEPVRWWRRRHNHGDDAEIPRPRGSECLAYEDDSANTNPVAVRIVNLRKVFQRGSEEFVAVDDLNLTMHENEVTVLLGHNGAGKSTTFNMLTGMLEMDGGDCYVYGTSARHDMAKVRRDISLCPQHNILWPELTCAQHLRFFGAVKGLSGSELEDAVDTMLRDVDLMPKKFERSADLSGGQKRKLSVAIAFIGRSRLVFLDEPTAGMDVAARRFTWDLIRRMAKGRAVLLTTHFMDEADLLGHTIAILSKGQLRACGSASFLKSTLGVGYTLSLSLRNVQAADGAINYVKHSMPGAERIQGGTEEVVFRLPEDAKASFPQLLQGLERQGADVGVRDFGITMTSLEDVFLRVAGEGTASAESQEQREQATATKKAALHVVSACAASASGTRSAFSHLPILLVKRYHNAKRDRRTQCLQIIVPVIGILVALLLSLINFFPETPQRYIEPAMYESIGERRLAFATSRCFLNASLLSPNLVHTDIGAPNASALSQYLQDTFKSHLPESRFTSMFCDDRSVPSALLPTLPGAILFFNASGYHSTAEVLNEYHQTVLQNAMQAAAPVLKVATWNLDWTKREQKRNNAVKNWIVGIILMIPFTFIPSTYVSYIVREKEVGAKHLQLVSGMSFSMYWLSNALFDILSFLITEALVLAVFGIFKRTEYIGSGEAFGATFLLFFFYALSSIYTGYTVSFLFKHHTTAQNVVMTVNFLSGFFLVILVNIFQAFPSTKDASDVLRFIFRVVPAYSLGDGLISLVTVNLVKELGVSVSAFEMDYIGWDLVFMAIEFPVFLALAVLLDHPERKRRQQRLLHHPDVKPDPIKDEDEDVAAERRRVEDHHNEPAGPDDDLVTVRHLRKQFKNGTVAVRNLSFGVHRGEVFGFLGTNGAGKTTTIAILCGEHYPTNGRAFVAGFDVVENAGEAQQNIGYCPQFDALLELLTTVEHLELYAGLRGVAPSARAELVDALVEICELTTYRETVAKDLSGGNKRKLSVALSLIGAPKVVFLDEPSAGMDPVARRGLWDVIQAVSEHCAVVLTTHHLEEVEALAHRVAIMVDGRLMCIGDKTHLKTKFGSGFELTLRMSTLDEVPEICRFVDRRFPGSKLTEERGIKLAYMLPSSIPLSEVFRVLQENSDALGVADYAVTQTSLEQVFLRISADAEAEKSADTAPAADGDIVHHDANNDGIYVAASEPAQPSSPQKRQSLSDAMSRAHPSP